MRIAVTAQLIALAVMAHMTPAAAYIVTLEPDDYAAGTDISEAWAHEGIHLETVTGNPIVTSPVFSEDVDYYPAFTESRVFGIFGAINDITPCYYAPSPTCNPYPFDDYDFLHIDFDRPIDFIEVFGTYSVDSFGMKLLGADGRVIQTVYNSTALWRDSINGFTYASSQASRESPDIYGVVIGGVIGASAIDMIRVNVPDLNVPEPGTMALLCIGLLGAATVRRRRATTHLPSDTARPPSTKR
jgi:hypothetical protein